MFSIHTEIYHEVLRNAYIMNTLWAVSYRIIKAHLNRMGMELTLCNASKHE